MSDADLLPYYHALRDLARHQLDALAAQDLTAFEAATAERDQAFGALQARDHELVGLDEAHLAQIRAAIAQILANDLKLQELLATSSAQAQDELGSIQHGLTALEAYATEADRPAIFIDHSS